MKWRRAELTVKIGVVGATGYVGGELLRLLLNHPMAELKAATSRAYAGKYIFKLHPNLRGRTDLKFTPPNLEAIASECDLAFTATPHGAAMDYIPSLLERGVKVIDMSADHRLKDPEAYPRWYGWTHKHPELLERAVYGLPELHRSRIRSAALVACPGCMATTAILGLAPLVKEKVIDEGHIVVDSKIGSSGAGANPTPASHHPERAAGVRPYKVVGHRHIAEVEQELSSLTASPIRIAFTPHAVGMVRGILSTIHTFTVEPLDNPRVWRIYRSFYKDEPFIRLVKDREGVHQLPNPMILTGSNYCDIGFELDDHASRLIVFSALDNLVKGAAGQGIQCMNIMYGFDERTGLEDPGLHPV